MSQFDVSWLDARQPFDIASRAPVPDGLHQFLDGKARPLQIVDLGAGTGANLTFLAPRLPGSQKWRLVERDPKLRSVAGAEASSNVEFIWQDADLSADLAAVLAEPTDLITASAFLDLVSPDWIADLVERGASLGAGFLIALSYDGQISPRPPRAQDADIASLLNRHQRGDKGFGPAAGPTATAVLRERLQDAGYRVETASTPWHIGPENGAFGLDFLKGVALTAKTVEPGLKASIDDWLTQREEAARSGALSLSVGHQDLFAWPIAA